MRKPWFLISCVVLATVILSTASVVTGQKRIATKEWWNEADAQEKLNLSDEQRAAIVRIEGEFGPRLKDIQKQVATSYRGVLTGLRTNPENNDALKEQQQAFVDASADLAVASVEHLRELRKVLNKDQWIELSSVAPGLFRVGSLRVSRMRKTLHLGGDNAEGTGGGGSN